MRIVQIFAALLAVAGISTAAPASAETLLTSAAPLKAQISGATATAEQYRSRYGYRSYGRGGRYRYRNTYYRSSYRPYRGYRSNRNWRRGRVVCRTVWRYRRPVQRCFRRY